MVRQEEDGGPTPVIDIMISSERDSGIHQVINKNVLIDF